MRRAAQTWSWLLEFQERAAGISGGVPATRNTRSILPDLSDFFISPLVVKSSLFRKFLTPDIRDQAEREEGDFTTNGEMGKSGGGGEKRMFHDFCG